MGLFPQFPYSNLHELNLDWIIEKIRQVTGDGVVLSVNGLSGIVTLYTENDITLPDCHFDTEWSVARLIDEKIAGIKFTGEKFFYITKNHDAEEFTVQEVYTSGNPPPYPITSVNGHDGNVVLAGDNLPYVIDGSYTIEDIVEAIESAIGAVIHGKKCNQAVTAGQYVFLIMSNIAGRADGLYKAVNNVSANTDWTSADLQAVSGGLGAVMATAESEILNRQPKIITTSQTFTITDATYGFILTDVAVNDYIMLCAHVNNDSNIIVDISNLNSSLYRFQLKNATDHSIITAGTYTIWYAYIGYN